MTKYALSHNRNKYDSLIIPIFEDTKAADISFLNSREKKLIKQMMERKDFEGKKSQTVVLYPENKEQPRAIVVGLGKQKDITIRIWKHAVGTGVVKAQGLKSTSIGLVLPAGLEALGDEQFMAQESVVAADMAGYAYDNHKQKDDQVTRVDKVELLCAAESCDEKALKKGMKDGQSIATAVNMTRSLGNTPPSIMTPTLLAKESEKMAKDVENLSVKVLEKSEIKKLGMGCLLGVSQGSKQEPKFIIIEYKGTKKKENPTVLVGKGITFDSGGLSLKPSQHMADMKFDMLGAATAIGTINAAARLKLKKHIIALVPTCENMPGGEAYRPDDILTAMNGKSVLIGNTDAEGRLILADALSYAHKYKPKEVIDFATLTGACMVAIGIERSGLFSKEERMVEGLLHSSEKVGEQLWHLPLGEEYSDAMKSDIADIKNISDSRYAGASTAAAFLEFFTKDEKGKQGYPWAHIDLSSCFSLGKGKSYIRTGANGDVVQSVVEYLRNA